MVPFWPYMRHTHESPISSATHMILLPSATGPAEASIIFLRTLTTGFHRKNTNLLIFTCDSFLSLCLHSIDFIAHRWGDISPTIRHLMAARDSPYTSVTTPHATLTGRLQDKTPCTKLFHRFCAKESFFQL
jgi:hypothetical protein